MMLSRTKEGCLLVCARNGVKGGDTIQAQRGKAHHTAKHGTKATHGEILLVR